MALCRSIYRDYRRYIATDERWYETLFLCQGFWAGCLYRVARAVCQPLRTRWLRRPLGLFFAVLQLIMEIVAGISISPQCEIGDGLYIGHFGNIIFPAHGRLGRNCNVSQGVTLGLAGRGANRGAPAIGDRVYIGPNAIVVGKITVGHDAKICAGAVVTRPIPPCAVVMGNPARVISYQGSFDDITYDGMESDPDRMAAIMSDVQSRAGAAAEVLAS